MPHWCLDGGHCWVYVCNLGGMCRREAEPICPFPGSGMIGMIGMFSCSDIHATYTTVVCVQLSEHLIVCVCVCV